MDIAQAMTVIEYKGFRIEVSPVGKGWRATIFAPGSTRALADSPSNLEKSRTEDIVAEAKRIIDARAVYTCAALRTPHAHYDQNAQQA